MAGYYIDAAMLRKRGACDEQIELFVQTFGNGRVLVNLANVKKAMAAGLDVTWPARMPWMRAPHGEIAEREAFRLWHRCSNGAKPSQILATLNSAPRIWQMVDAESATGGHR